MLVAGKASTGSREGEQKIYKGHFNFAASHARKGDALGQAKRGLSQQAECPEMRLGILR